MTSLRKSFRQNYKFSNLNNCTQLKFQVVNLIHTVFIIYEESQGQKDHKNLINM